MRELNIQLTEDMLQMDSLQEVEALEEQSSVDSVHERGGAKARKEYVPD